MPKITSIKGRILYNSRGSQTIEIDVTSDNEHVGRVCAPSGASVGKHEAQSFPQNKPEKSLEILKKNVKKFVGLDPSNLKTIHETLREIDSSPNYSKVGGSLAFALTIASIESASKSLRIPMFKLLSKDSIFRYPFPLGNILGGGAHAGPG
ncbi:MAG: phosphopyruvate hydratase, partial [Nitrosotalea sp.]